jgi:hypothetical protein
LRSWIIIKNEIESQQKFTLSRLIGIFMILPIIQENVGPTVALSGGISHNDPTMASISSIDE